MECLWHFDRAMHLFADRVHSFHCRIYCWQLQEDYSVILWHITWVSLRKLQNCCQNYYATSMLKSVLQNGWRGSHNGDFTMHQQWCRDLHNAWEFYGSRIVSFTYLATTMTWQKIPTIIDMDFLNHLNNRRQFFGKSFLTLLARARIWFMTDFVGSYQRVIHKTKTTIDSPNMRFCDHILCRFCDSV